MKSLYDTLHIPDPTKPDAEQPGEPMPKRSAKALCRSILESPEYLRTVVDRIMFHELPAAVEVRLWDYAYGKPVEHVEVKDKTKIDAFRQMSVDELEARARQVLNIAALLQRGDSPDPPSESDEEYVTSTTH